MANNEFKIDYADEKPTINYWKEIQKNIQSELNDIKGLVLLTHNSVEFVDIIDFLQNVRKEEFSTVLYISLVRSFNYMKKALLINPLDKKRMIFIDCVSGYAFPIEENIDDAIYHKPPSNLSEMKEIINFGIEKSDPNIVIIDSLSQFVNFSQPTQTEIDELYSFLNTLKKDMDKQHNTFILIYDSKLCLIDNLPKSLTDSILRIEKSVKENKKPIGTFSTKDW